MYKAAYYLFNIINLIFLLPDNCIAQAFKRFDNIPVSHFGNNLRYAWTGGVNSVQFGQADVNNDGLKDVIVYDKSNEKFLTFLALNTNSTIYKFENSYSINFPTIYSWIVMKDYNCDGIEDIFTYAGGALINTYIGYYVNDTLHYKLQQNGLFYQGFSSITNIFSSSTIKPAIFDVNHDGDLDIISFNLDGNQIIYYENLRIENNIHCDSLFFKKIDRCWGNVRDVFTSSFSLRDTCTDKFYRLAGNEQILHTGSSLDAFDADGNNVEDLLIGSVSIFNLTMLYNHGTPSYASFLSQDISFPSYNTPFNTSSFGSPAFIDVNNDTKTDLMVSMYDDGSANINNIWYYKNNGATNNQFELQQKDFLLDNMIDAGENSNPCFLDVDGDGLKDIIVGSGGFKDYVNPTVSKLLLYKNIGTTSSPSFNLVSDDFLEVSSFNISNPVPAVGDIDNDGDTDIVVGILDGRILLYENTAGANQVPVFIYKGLLKDGNNTNISVGLNAAPFLIDIDRDGKTDLVIGKRNGNLILYKGTANNTINLTYVTDSLGKIKIETFQSANGYTYPCITDINQDGKYDLILGTNYSGLQFYDNIEADLYGKYTTTRAVVDDYLGWRTTATVADITNDNKPEILTGNIDGGLIIFSQSPPDIINGIAQSSIKIKLNIFPNPAKEQIVIEQNDLKGNFNMKMINLLGQTVIQKQINHQNNIVLDVSDLANGVYLLKLSNSEKEGIQRVVIQH